MSHCQVQLVFVYKTSLNTMELFSNRTVVEQQVGIHFLKSECVRSLKFTGECSHHMMHTVWHRKVSFAPQLMHADIPQQLQLKESGS